MDITVISDNGVIKVYNLHKKKPIAMFGQIKSAIDEEVVQGTYGFDEQHVYQGYKTGKLDYWSFDRRVETLIVDGEEEEKDICTGEIVKTLEYNRHIKAVQTMNNERLAVGSLDGYINVKKINVENGDEEDLVDFKVGQGNLHSMRTDPYFDQQLAVGMKDSEVSLYNIETQQRAWRARNLPNDFLRLRVPIWTTAIAFHSRDKLVVGTGQYQVRLYDCRKPQPQPVFNTLHGRSPISAIKTSDQFENLIVAGDGGGSVAGYDIRTGRLLSRYSGSTGAIRSIDIHPTLPLLAVAGLDRHVRVFDLNTKKLLQKLYMKQKITAVMFSSQEPPSKSEVDALERKKALRKALANSKKQKKNQDDEEDEDEDDQVQDDDEIDLSGDIIEDDDSELEESDWDDDSEEEDRKTNKKVNAYFREDMELVDSEVNDKEASDVWKEINRNTDTAQKDSTTTTSTSATTKVVEKDSKLKRKEPTKNSKDKSNNNNKSNNNKNIKVKQEEKKEEPKKKIAVSSLKKFKK